MKKKIKNIAAKISERIAQWLIRHIDIESIEEKVADRISVRAIAD